MTFEQVIEQLEEDGRAINVAILCTLTNDLRNTLTDINIQRLALIDEFRHMQRTGEYVMKVQE